MYVCIYIYTHTYIYVCIHIYVYICMYVYMCMYVYIYIFLKKWEPVHCYTKIAPDLHMGSTVVNTLRAFSSCGE